MGGRFLAVLWRGLFPPKLLPGDDGRNAMMRRLLGEQTPLLSVRPKEVEARWRALRPVTAVEREQRDAIERSAERIGQEAERWLGRR